MFSDVLAVETFGRKMEKQVGADLFWILDIGQTLVPMLVQAKRTEETEYWQEKWESLNDFVEMVPVYKLSGSD
ncbi:MAG: hypothetical protein K8R88_01695 [Armatimonadetes bacterium]|nr:hypothetical protein [Armatimonadota bacterium]